MLWSYRVSLTHQWVRSRSFLQTSVSLIPRPFPPPVFDCLPYAKMEGGVLYVFCILQVIKKWRWWRPGNEANNNSNTFHEAHLLNVFGTFMLLCMEWGYCILCGYSSAHSLDWLFNTKREDKLLSLIAWKSAELLPSSSSLAWPSSLLSACFTL